ncbi:MAG: OmpA family protein [Gammaproteobacteria bacterium]|nr:OmpA family protein [Gammaproteobacteria bacterium]
MKKLAIISALVITAVSHTAPANAESHKEQQTGAVSGAFIGAAAGGPIGFILGAAFGGLIGDNVASKKENEQLTAKVEEAEVYQSQLQLEVENLQSQVSTTSDTSFNDSELLQMDVLFHTAAADLDDLDRERVTQLASFLKKYPDLSIKLDGFADPRGNADKNKALSMERINSVKTMLTENGVNPERIIATAHGETANAAPEGDLDAYALERRVSIRFLPKEVSTELAEK